MFFTTSKADILTSLQNKQETTRLFYRGTLFPETKNILKSAGREHGVFLFTAGPIKQTWILALVGLS